MSSRASDHQPDDLELAYRAAHAHRRSEDRLPSTPTRTAVLNAARQVALDAAAAPKPAPAAKPPAAPRPESAGVIESVMPRASAPAGATVQLPAGAGPAAGPAVPMPVVPPTLSVPAGVVAGLPGGLAHTSRAEAAHAPARPVVPVPAALQAGSGTASASARAPAAAAPLEAKATPPAAAPLEAKATPPAAELLEVKATPPAAGSIEAKATPPAAASIEAKATPPAAASPEAKGATPAAVPAPSAPTPALPATRASARADDLPFYIPPVESKAATGARSAPAAPAAAKEADAPGGLASVTAETPAPSSAPASTGSIAIADATPEDRGGAPAGAAPAATVDEFVAAVTRSSSAPAPAPSPNAASATSHAPGASIPAPLPVPGSAIVEPPASSEYPSMPTAPASEASTNVPPSSTATPPASAATPVPRAVPPLAAHIAARFAATPEAPKVPPAPPVLTDPVEPHSPVSAALASEAPVESKAGEASDAAPPSIGAPAVAAGDDASDDTTAAGIAAFFAEPGARPSEATPPSEIREPDPFDEEMFPDSLFADHPRQSEPSFETPGPDAGARAPSGPDADATIAASADDRLDAGRPEAANTRSWKLRAFAGVLAVVAAGGAWKMVTDGSLDRSLGTVFADAGVQSPHATAARPDSVAPGTTPPAAAAGRRTEGETVATAPAAADRGVVVALNGAPTGTRVADAVPAASPQPHAPTAANEAGQGGAARAGLATTMSVRPNAPSPAATPPANAPQTVATATAPRPEQPRVTLQGQSAETTSLAHAEPSTPGAAPGHAAAPAVNERVAAAKTAAAPVPDPDIAAKAPATRTAAATNPDWNPEEVARAAARARAARRQIAETSPVSSLAAPADQLAAAPAPAPAAAPTAQAAAAPPAPAQTLQQAADAGDVTAIRQILAGSGTPVDAPDSFGRTALMHAVLAQHPAAVRALLAAGADPNRADRAGFTPRAAAQTGGNGEIAQMLGPSR